MKRFVLAACSAASACAWAQTAAPATPASPSSSTSPSTSPSAATQTLVITGNPLGSGEVASPTSVLSGQALQFRRGSSLGETLEGLPGVGSTYFGPNANRPVIRGQDGDRIRVLSNAGASLDASSLSFDHAVPLDPLVVERIEVLRGPTALLYGGSAIGGVVNAIDNRIPKARLDGPSGTVEFRLGGAAGERSAAAVLETGGPQFALHADAFGRKTDDLRVPAFNRPLADGGVERSTRVVNSASSAQGGAVGASWLGTEGYLGLSVDSYRNVYGVVVEDDVKIDMRRDKLALAGEWRAPTGWFSKIRGQASATDYQHQEVSGDGSVGTTFKTRGADLRLEAVHRAASLGAAGRLEGTAGFQAESSRFSALGEEAFVPITHTRQSAVFVLERWSFGQGHHLEGGLRQENVSIQSDGDSDPLVPRFGPAQQRSFSPRSLSLAGLYKLSTQWQLTAGLAATQRAPTHYELFADGVHAATAAYERGDPRQALERGRNLDVGLVWESGNKRVKLNAYDARFSNYIVLSATGEPDFVSEDGEAFPVYAFRGVRARLRGAELEGNWRLLEGPRQLDLDASFDTVRGIQLDKLQALPRLAPWRLSTGLKLQQGAWTARAEIRHAAAQQRVPDNDLPTPAWTIVNLSAAYAFKLGQLDAQLFGKLQNLGNRLAFKAGSVPTVRALSPLPGRQAQLGLRLAL